MKKLPSLAVYALMAPAITLGIGSAFATDPPSRAYPDATQQRTTQDQRTQDQRTQDQRQMPSQSQKDKGMSTADRAKHGMTKGTYLSNVPANSFGADDLIGSDLMSRSDNESVGKIGDLVIDEDGQIAAVIVEVGGFLGLGTKEIAVSWDSIERRLNEDRDGYDFFVNTTKDDLRNAPAYTNEARRY